MAGKRCGNGIQRHPQRAEIEDALARNVPLLKIQERWGIHPSAACRHRQKMRVEQPEVFAALAAADWAVPPEDLEKLRIETSDGYLRVLRGQLTKLTLAQDRNLEVGNDGTAAHLAAQIHKSLELIGRAVKQIGDDSVRVKKVTNNVLIMPQLFQLRTRLIEVLRPYPEARGAVLALFREMAGEDAGPFLEHAA